MLYKSTEKVSISEKFDVIRLKMLALSEGNDRIMIHVPVKL